MYHPHHMYSFPEAVDIALSPMLSFVDIMTSAHPEAAAAGRAAVHHSRTELYKIGEGILGVCAMPHGLVFTGFRWENERCRACGKSGCFPSVAM